MVTENYFVLGYLDLNFNYSSEYRFRDVSTVRSAFSGVVVVSPAVATRPQDSAEQRGAARLAESPATRNIPLEMASLPAGPFLVHLRGGGTSRNKQSNELMDIARIHDVISNTNIVTAPGGAEQGAERGEGKGGAESQFVKHAPHSSQWQRRGGEGRRGRISADAGQEEDGRRSAL